MVGTKPVEFLFLQERCLKGVGEGGGMVMVVVVVAGLTGQRKGRGLLLVD